MHKTFESFMGNNVSLTKEEQERVASNLRNGNLEIPSDDFDLHGLSIRVFDYNGVASDEDINQRVKDQIANSILNGKRSGIVNDEPYNKEWQIELEYKK
jgi:hypothetical protein